MELVADDPVAAVEAPVTGAGRRGSNALEPLVVAMSVAAVVATGLLFVVTKKRLFARQIAPADSPIQVV